jgi:hypothetical protein
MALLFETPAPHTHDGRRLHVARLVSTARGDDELLGFCRRIGAPPRVIRDGVILIGGGQIATARAAGAKEITPAQLDKIIRSTFNG